tara:strand:- start:1453 stop:2481 length:1029 start_codon:yes stop_codon:yes gene_type:complete
MSSLKLLHSGGNGVIISAPSSNPAANRTITLNDNYAGDGSFVTANSSGNVGIGTASPDQILHLNKTSGDTYLRLQGGTNQGTLIHATDGTLLGGFVSGGAVGGGTSDMAMRVESGNNMLFAHGTTERIRINSSGNVGIGTTSPDKKLHVDTGSSSANHFIAEFTGTNDSNAASCNFYYFGCGSDDNRTGLYWEHQNVGNARMWMDDSLNLRQSSSTPTANNSGTAFSYAGGSDYRLKNNVVNYTNAITELNQLKPYKFNYIETDRIIVDKPNVLVSGFYAHEAGAVVPNSLIGTKDEVDFNGDPIYQSLKYEKFVPLLTAALQEAVAKIETLETKVAALEGA